MSIKRTSDIRIAEGINRLQPENEETIARVVAKAKEDRAWKAVRRHLTSLGIDGRRRRECLEYAKKNS